MGAECQIRNAVANLAATAKGCGRGQETRHKRRTPTKLTCTSGKMPYHISKGLTPFVPTVPPNWNRARCDRLGLQPYRAYAIHRWMAERGSCSGGDMAASKKVVASLLNRARPKLLAGWDSRLTDCDELAVRHKGKRLYAVLSSRAHDFLDLLDGTRSLNELAAELMRLSGRVRHHLILDTVARLHTAGLLEPLEPDVAHLLHSQSARSKAQRFLSFVRKAASIGLYLPLGLSPSAPVLRPGNVLIRILFCTFVILYPLSLAPYLSWLTSAGAAVSVFGNNPVAALMAVLAGLVAAISLISLSRALLLGALGRTVYGFGIRFTVGIPNLAGDQRDEAMLNREERLVYRAGVLALLCFGAVLVAIGYKATGSSALFYAGFGVQLAILADLSPIWPGDLCSLLEEALGSRRLRHSSGRYVVRKLWVNVVKKGHPGRAEMTLMLYASAWIMYLFIAAMVLAWLAPGTIDAVTSVLLNPGVGPGQMMLALLAALYLWVALAFFTLALVAALIAAAAQLLAAGRSTGKPFEVQQALTLPLEAVAEELRAVPPFSHFPKELIISTLGQGRVEKYRKGTTIIRQGEPGDTCYVLRTGNCEVSVEDASGRTLATAHLGPGHLFGEVALLSASPRTGTVTAMSDVELVAIDRETFLALVQEGGVAKETVLKQVRIHLFLKEIELLRGVSAPGMAVLMNAFQLVNMQPDQEIVHAGDPGDSMYVIYQGRCRVTDKNGHEVAILEAGQYFGEISLVTGATRSANVAGLENGVLVKLPASIYQDVIVKEFATGVLLDREVEARLEDLTLL